MAVGGKLRMEDGTASGKYAGFKASDSTLSADVIWTLPTTDGSAGQFLSTDGSKNLSFQTVDMGTEATARMLADVTLQLNIDAEITARLAADSSLQTELDLTQGNLGSAFDGSGGWNGFSGTKLLDSELTFTSCFEVLDSATPSVYKASASQSIAKNDVVLADSSGGSFNLTLPASPSAGDQIFVHDYKSQFATNKVVLLRNGLNIKGSANDMDLDVAGKVYSIVYVDATWGWSVL